MALRKSSLPDKLLINPDKKEYGLNMYNFHYHDGYEIYILKSGHRKLIINDVIYVTNSYDAAMIPPNSFHKSMGNEKYSGLCISFSDKYISRFFSDYAKEHLLTCFRTPVIPLTKETISEINTLCKNISDDPKNEFIYFSCILNLLNRFAKNADVSSNIAANKDMSPVLTYIKENYTKIKSLDDICKALYLTKSHACNLFKKETGMTITYYINSLRIQLSCDMLINTDTKIEEISIKCGFESPSYFNKVFKNFMNCSPGVFRNRNNAFKQ